MTVTSGTRVADCLVPDLLVSLVARVPIPFQLSASGSFLLPYFLFLLKRLLFLFHVHFLFPRQPQEPLLWDTLSISLSLLPET